MWICSEIPRSARYSPVRKMHSASPTWFSVTVLSAAPIPGRYIYQVLVMRRAALKTKASAKTLDSPDHIRQAHESIKSWMDTSTNLP